MRIEMIPGSCSNEHSSTGSSFCQACFSSFLIHGCYPDRPCITGVIDDGQEETTLILRNGDYQKAVVLSAEKRQELAYGGWSGWVRFVEELPETPIAGK